MRSSLFYRYHATLKKPLLSSQPAVSKRTIVSLKALPGIFDHLIEEKQHLSPLHGVVLSESRALAALHQKAIKEKNPSATSRLLLALFYRHGEAFQSTRNKKLPAYSLSPTLLANIIYHLDAGTLANIQVREALSAKWKRQHDGKLSWARIHEILDIIVSAKKESRGHQRYLTETILLAFLYHKSHAASDLFQFLDALESHARVLRSGRCRQQRGLDEVSLEKTKEILLGFKHTFCATTLKKHYEAIMLTLMLEKQSLRRVDGGYYGFKGAKPRPNCVETALHNVFNVLLFDPVTKKFDFDLLPQSLKPTLSLIAFYQAQDFLPDHINANTVQQAFMNLVSGHPLLQYESGDYELDVVVSNVIPLMNMLFGSNAKHFTELSAQFSDGRRRVTFSQRDNRVVIMLQAAAQEEQSFVLEFTEKSAFFKAESFFNDKGFEVDAFYLPLFRYAADHIAESPLLFSLLSSLMKDKNTHLQDQVWHLLDRQVELESYLPYLCHHWGSMLHDAIRKGHALMVGVLLALGTNPAAKDGFERSPLFCALDQPEMVKQLLRAGVSPHEKNAFGRSPLHLAENVTTVKLLLEAGACPNVCDHEGRTPLHFSRKAEIIDVLVAAGARVNAVDKRGATPLHLAGTVACVDRLLKAGARSDLADFNGETPLKRALNSWRRDIAQLLEPSVGEQGLAMRRK